MPLPIFIFGITQRSGTHYLYDLLLRHPDCRPALSATSILGSWEDHLLHFSDDLSRYADALVGSNMLNDDATRERLMRSIGAGLISFLTTLDGVTDDARRPVTKTPLPENIDRFTALFPGAVAVLLARNPFAVVASGTRTFGRDADHWIRVWRDGARWFVRQLTEHPESTALVRYEDLYADPATVLHGLFPKLGLDPDVYDFDAVRALPVRGSSHLGRVGDGTSWSPVAPKAGFDPLSRGRDLPERVRQRILWRALPEMKLLGYAEQAAAAPTGPLIQYFRAESAVTRVLQGSRLALTDLYEAQARRVRRRRRRPPVAHELPPDLPGFTT